MKYLALCVPLGPALGSPVWHGVSGSPRELNFVERSLQRDLPLAPHSQPESWEKPEGQHYLLLKHLVFNHHPHQSFNKSEKLSLDIERSVEVILLDLVLMKLYQHFCRKKRFMIFKNWEHSQSTR